MLDTGVGVVRMWADETSRLSRFRMLFTSFADRECLLQIILSPLPIILLFQLRWESTCIKDTVHILVVLITAPYIVSLSNRK